jgi:hypothetical protein
MGTPLQTVYKGTIGHTINFVLQESGSPVSLSSATVVAYLKSVGSNAAVWNKNCTVDDITNGLCHYTTASGDLATTGMFYTLAVVTYSTSTTAKTFQGPQIEVIEYQENLVTVDDFLQFIDIPSENAKSEGTIRRYLEDAETQLNLDMRGLKTSTDSDFIKIRRSLIMRLAGIAYFMNSDENFIDPNKRVSKIELWQKQYNRALDKLNEVVSTDGETGLLRRVKNSAYSDANSYLYEE